jgi:hypothetical protein
VKLCDVETFVDDFGDRSDLGPELLLDPVKRKPKKERRKMFKKVFQMRKIHQHSIAAFHR